MTANDKNNKPGCGKREPDIFENNAQGIIAPSVTAKPQMREEGYVESNATEDDA